MTKAASGRRGTPGFMRPARTAFLACAVALASAATACGQESTRSGDPGASTVPPANAGDLRYTCGTFAFGPDILTRVEQAERADNPAAAALRAHLGLPGPDIDFLPDAGWILAGMNATSAEFVTVEGDLGMKVVVVAAGPDGWRVTGWGDCQARRILPAGLGDADWVLAPDQPPIGPATRTFVALVTERDCASGKSSEGRIAGPDVVQVGGDLLVTFAVRPLAAGSASCQGNPATRVTVDLGEPMGDRRLLDGGTLPPRDPAAREP